MTGNVSLLRTEAQKANQGATVKILIVVLAIWLMVALAVLSSVKLDFGAKRRRRHALEVLSHAKFMLWRDRFDSRAEREAYDIINLALMKVYAE